MGARLRMAFGQLAATATTVVAIAAVVAAMTVVATALMTFALPTIAWADDTVYPAGVSPEEIHEPCPAGGSHVFEESILEPAGDDTDGVRLYTCTKCGYSYRMAIPHTGHDWGPWIVDVEPTCVSAGSEHRECHRHEDQGQIHYEYREIPALSATGEHTWGDWVIDSEPTSTDDGVEHRTCSVCGAVETQTIPATGEVATTPEPAAPETEPATTDVDAAAPNSTAGDADGSDAAGDRPAMLGPFILSFEPNAMDAAAAVGDITALGVGIFVLAPLLGTLAWAHRRMREGRQAYLASDDDDDDGSRDDGIGGDDE